MVGERTKVTEEDSGTDTGNTDSVRRMSDPTAVGAIGEGGEGGGRGRGLRRGEKAAEEAVVVRLRVEPLDRFDSFPDWRLLTVDKRKPPLQSS